ncbi:hypothetical protein [Paenibacillus alvei]|uniref:hypothetical protein n=1 Tax=Paenibacillus alvei TaxID=44250 RepID=UPI00227F3FBA|nr:hypothetical protein [Paenibacillus alvei]
MIEPESVSGQLEHNRGFRRSLLRGLSKVSIEMGGFPLPQFAAVGNNEAKRSSSGRN